METRTRQLLMQHQQLQKQCAELQEKLSQREEEMLELQIENEELRKQYANIKMAKRIQLGDDDTREMRNRVNKLVRDIDKCIAMLKTEH